MVWDDEDRASGRRGTRIVGAPLRSVNPCPAGIAGNGQVVVTRTVRDLATGTDLEFTPLGPVALRGVPGEWELFTVKLR